MLHERRIPILVGTAWVQRALMFAAIEKSLSPIICPYKSSSNSGPSQNLANTRKRGGLSEPVLQLYLTGRSVELVLSFLSSIQQLSRLPYSVGALSTLAVKIPASCPFALHGDDM